MLRFARPAMVAVVASTFLGLSACGSGGGPTSPSNTGKVTGTYTLEYADDEELPVAVHRGPYLDPNTGIFFNNFVLEVTNGYIELRENETFYVALQFAITADGMPTGGTFEFEGVWDEIKDEIVLRVQAPFIATLVLERDGNWLTMDVDLLGLGEETELEFDLFKR